MKQIEDFPETVESLLAGDTPQPNKHSTLAYRPNPDAPEVHLTKGDARDYVRAVRQANNRHPWAEASVSIQAVFAMIAILLCVALLAIFTGEGTKSPLALTCAVAALVLAIVNKLADEKRGKRNDEIARERLTALEAVMTDHAVPFTVDAHRLEVLKPGAGEDALRSAMDHVTPEDRDTMLSLIEKGDNDAVQTMFDALLADAIERKATEEK